MSDDTIRQALQGLDAASDSRDTRYPISFEHYLAELRKRPGGVLRNIFQVFHDMVKTYVGEGIHEHSDESDAFQFVFYDWSRLFVEGADQPFFADRLFAYRLMNHVESLRRGTQQNKIYVFDGPPGCGKSTFLDNLLMKLQAYANTEDGMRLEVIWRLDASLTEGNGFDQDLHGVELLAHWLGRDVPPGGTPCDTGDEGGGETALRPPAAGVRTAGGRLEIPCPSHDNPIMLVPKLHRRDFLSQLLADDVFKETLFSEKEYEWVFEDSPCTFCSTLYEALLEKLGSPSQVLRMVHARPYRFNRRLGEGISVYNPGDRPLRQNVWTNPLLQRRLNTIFGGREPVRFIYSPYAKTNNGVYALMDIKSHNTERMIELHNIISEGVHKVEDTEENVHSLFLAVMNPEDKKNVQHIPSFSDRIEYVHIPYVLDLKTEVAIYREIFGRHIDAHFLPRVLRNFARVIISSRIKTRSEALLEWIGNADKYSQYCDKNLQLLKIEIYMGQVPPWLSEDDRKRLTPKRRRRILAEAENEGIEGFSGRDSIKIFNEFFSAFASDERLINMSALNRFFTHVRSDLSQKIPEGFLDALLHLYNFKILQEVKESLYYYNEEQISRDIQNYLFALNFDPGSTVTCRYTGDRLEVDEAFFNAIENHLLGKRVEAARRRAFRRDTQKEYTSRTLTQEIMVEGKKVTETLLFQTLFERYVYHLKEKVLDPFLENENFRRAIRDYDLETFKTYDRRIQDDVMFLMKNLGEKFGYTPKGAREICMYVIDGDLAKTFAARP